MTKVRFEPNFNWCQIHLFIYFPLYYIFSLEKKILVVYHPLLSAKSTEWLVDTLVALYLLRDTPFFFLQESIFLMIYSFKKSSLSW